MKTLNIWTGPTHSAKTKKAMARARRMVGVGHDLVLVRPIQSKRGFEENEDPGNNEDYLVTQDGERWPAISVSSAQEIVSAAEGCTAFWLDEPGLFLNEVFVYEAIVEIRTWADVLVSSISASSEMDPFGTTMPRLLAVADKIHQCFADCDECKRLESASRSWHIAGPKTERVEVGDKKAYDALCPSCWNMRTEKRALSV